MSQMKSNMSKIGTKMSNVGSKIRTKMASTGSKMKHSLGTTKVNMSSKMRKLGTTLKNITISTAPTEMNILVTISLLFSIFYFFPAKKYVQTTTWITVGTLVIMSLMGITYAFKNVIKTSQNLSFGSIFFYVVIPFASVVVIPILMNHMHKKYHTYYEETNQTISKLDTLNTTVSALFMAQIIVLFYLYSDFIVGKHANSYLKPSVLLLLFLINAVLVVYENVIVNDTITDG